MVISAQDGHLSSREFLDHLTVRKMLSDNTDLIGPGWISPEKNDYLIFVWAARSSAFVIGRLSVSAVREAARLAVYEERRIKVKK